ncbi:MAG: 50S ribosomal protein L29 [Planctomycetota bacterium]
MTAEEMRKKTDQELAAELKTLKDGLFKLRFRKVTDVIEDPNQIGSMKKDIARIHTLVRERQMKKQKEEAAAKKAAPAPQAAAKK